MNTSMSELRHIPLARGLLVACLLLLALGALPAGWGLMMQPDGSSLGMSVNLLAGSVFNDFTVPGLVLFAFFGVGSLFALGGLLFWSSGAPSPSQPALRLKENWPAALAALLGLGQMIWIVVQIIVIRTFSILQPTLFIVGAAILFLALRVAFAPNTKKHSGS